MLGPAEALASDHLRSVGALTETPLVAGAALGVPTGPFVVDGRHAGIERPCPDPGADEPRWLGPPRALPDAVAATGSRPFEGLRILDLGVIVAGGELGRLFADLGAEVVKVESATYPDGLRQTPPDQPMSRSWALTHRNESSLGIDLRHPEGASIFRELVAASDAVFANFKPGTLAALGFSYDELREANARIVLAESSAFGASGPWSDRMGYGPLVRATTGVSRLWTSQDADRDGPPAAFYDATTIFPDHVVARLTAIAALAALIDREGSGSGAHVHISQAEAAVNQLAGSYVTEAARAAGLPVAGDDGIDGVYPCAGDDEWCVISVRSDDDRIALAKVLDVDELPAATTDVMAVVTDWTAGRDKAEVVDAVQRAGLAAGPMNRAVDVLADPQVVFRGLYADLVHPLFAAPMPSERHPAPFRHIPDADLGPAPMAGEHTRRIGAQVLGLDAGDTERLIDAGVLFAWPATSSAQTASPS
jgi:crotonobetainyl-CoA:carnitine CoA-transferase CaiB-like acyl-CoA transferase